MAMFDINGEEFFVGDTLKVIKQGGNFKAGEIVVCNIDDGSRACRFHRVGEDPERNGWWCTNNKLQKL